MNKLLHQLNDQELGQLILKHSAAMTELNRLIQEGALITVALKAEAERRYRERERVPSAVSKEVGAILRAVERGSFP